MRLFKRLPIGLQIGLPICAFIAAATALAIVHDNAHPDSNTVEKIGREAIPEQTGQAVKQIDCDRVVDINFARQIRCRVLLADGTAYETIASVRTRGDQNRSQGAIIASFSPPPNLKEPAMHDPPSTGPASDDQMACIQSAGTDINKLQACTESH